MNTKNIFRVVGALAVLVGGMFPPLLYAQSYPSPHFFSMQVDSTATLPNVAITGGTITGLSAPIPLGSGGTGAATATGATSSLQYLQGGTGSVARTLTNKFQDSVSVKDFGVQCNNTDESVGIQAAINAVAVTGGSVYFPQTSGSSKCSFAAGLTVPGAVRLYGEGKYETILIYTGTGSAISAAGTGNNQVTVENLTLQLTGTNAKGIDATRFISSTFRSLHIVNQSGSGQTGMYVNPTATTSNPFFNVVDDVTFDGALANGMFMSLTVPAVNGPNRWRILAITCLSTVNCINLDNVQGSQIIAPYCDQQSGTCIIIGAASQRIQVIAPTQETAAGGTMFNINAAANRIDIIAPKMFAGVYGTTTLGTRGTLVGDWDTGIQFSGSTTATPVSTYTVGDNLGVVEAGIKSLSLNTPLGIASGGTNASTATSATSNLQYLQGSTGSTAISVTNKLQQHLNVADFGALCNGVHDDTANFNSALAAATSLTTGAQVDVPSSSTGCLLSGVITIGSNTMLAGQGPGASHLLASVINIATLVNLNGNGAQVRDLDIVSNNAGTNTSGTAILYGNFTNLAVRNVTIEGPCIGIDVNGNTTFVDAVAIRAVIGGTCRGIRVGLNTTQAGTVDARITNTTVASNAANRALADLEVIDAGGLYLSNNDMLYATHGTLMDPGTNNVVQWPFFVNTVLGDTTGTDSLAITPVAASSGIVEGLVCHGCWISSSAAGAGMNIGNGSGNVTGIHFIGARVFGNFANGANVISGTDVTFDASAFCNNNVANNGSGSISIASGVNNVLIRNNTLGGKCDINGAAAGEFYSVNLNGTSSNIIVTGNDMTGVNTGMAGSTPTGNSIVANNAGITNTTVPHTQQEIDKSYTYNTPTTGQTVTLATSTETAIINPAGTLATLTVTLPGCTASYDGSIARFSSTQSITALTVNATSGTVVDAPTTLAVGGGAGYLCRGANTSWYRLY